MKHKMWSRLLSMALAVMMIVSIVPNSAFAEAANEITSTSQVQEIPAEETQTPEEVTVPEAETPAEPSTEPAPTEEPVAEPTAEPTVEPTAEPTQAPAETAVPSEQPSAEPTAAPESTETPNASAQPSETPAASATPAPSESPVPSETPAPSEEPAIDGQALLDELMAIEDDEAFLKAVGELTEEQTAALEALGEEALAEYSVRKQNLEGQDEKFESFYEQLLKAETEEDYIVLVGKLSQEETEAFLLYLSQEQLDNLAMKEEQLFKDNEVMGEVAEDTFKRPVDYTNVAPFLPAVEGSELMSMRNYVGLFSLSSNIPEVEDPTLNNPNGLGLSKSIQDNQDGTYTISLESYVTGTISVEKEAAPTDIVLVLDQSGSMDYCINCGQKEGDHSRDGSCKNSTATYIPTYDIATSGVYYYYSYGGYRRAYYCEGGRRCEGGWFTQQHYYIHGGSLLTPKTSPNGDGTQFYVMQESGKTYFKSRLDALKEAVTGFVSSVQKTAQETNKNHRIAIVGFGSDNRGSYTNTELLSTKYVVGYQTAERNKSYYQQALVPANINGAVNGQLTTAIEKIDANGGTATNLGMEMAQEVLNQNPVLPGEARNQVVVVFTDGDPGIYTNDSDYTKTNNYANPAIKTAKELKAAGVSVYAVGVFDGADAGAPVNSEVTDWDNDAMPNRFMQYLSSNYKNAQSMENGGAKTGDGYYLSASDSNALNDIFDKIADNIQSGAASVELSSSAVVKDVLTDEYKFATGDESQDIEIYTVEATSIADTGEITWSTQKQSMTNVDVNIDELTKTVTVTGFDFGNNFISPTGYQKGDPTQEGSYHGSKLVVEITVKPDYSKTLGGNYIVSNTNESGIYENSSKEEATGKFNIPASDIDIQYDFNVQDKTIYLTNSANLNELFTEMPSVNGKNNAYVDIVYTVTTLDGIEVGTYTIPHGAKGGSWTTQDEGVVTPLDCTEYKVTCSVTPTYDPSVMDKVETGAEAYNGEKGATVHVLYPTVQAKDKYIALGESTDFDKCWESVETTGWYDAEEHTNNPAPVTTAPEVTDVKVKEVVTGTEYPSSEGLVSPKQDTDYNIVAVKLGAGETGWITDAAKFAVLEDKTTKHNADGHTCIQPTEDDQSENPHDFTIHVYSVNGDLQIKKTLENFNASKGDDVVFTFKAVNNDTQQVYYATIPFQKAEFVNRGSVMHDTTLKDIPTGTYTVYELTSAGYVAVGATEVKDVAVGGAAAGCAEFTNESDNNKTPGDNSSVLNKWLGDKFAPVTSEAANG